jgi:hypothetical protein
MTDNVLYCFPQGDRGCTYRLSRVLIKKNTCNFLPHQQEQFKQIIDR